MPQKDTKTVSCEKCKATMTKKGSLTMSNSKFDIYKCGSCGYEKKICMGLTKEF